MIRTGMLVLVCALAPLRADATQLLVSNGFPGGPWAVLTVNPTTLHSNGVFGEANNFSPAPGAMAKDSRGRVYILDTNRDRIQRFDRAGHLLDIFASTNFKINGLFHGITIDSVDNVYVSSDGDLTFDSSDDAIVRFDAEGNFLGTLGQATNAATGYRSGGALGRDSQDNIYTIISGNVVRFSTNGTFLGTFGQATSAAMGASFSGDLVFRQDGHLLAETSTGILQFDAAGNYLGIFAGRASGGFALDQADNLYASDMSTNQIAEYSKNGSFLASFIDPSFHGISHLLVIPEPTSLVLAIVGFAAAALFCTRSVVER